MFEIDHILLNNFNFKCNLQRKSYINDEQNITITKVVHKKKSKVDNVNKTQNQLLVLYCN